MADNGKSPAQVLLFTGYFHGFLLQLVQYKEVSLSIPYSIRENKAYPTNLHWAGYLSLNTHSICMNKNRSPDTPLCQHLCVHLYPFFPKEPSLCKVTTDVT